MPGRNDACPCGSGKKFKNCCVNKGSRLPKGLLLLIAVIAVIAAIGLIPSILGEKKESVASPVSRVPSGRVRMTQPGPAPAGKVWSEEHGHWHDAPSGTVVPATMPAAAPQAAAFTPAPQPPGPVPAGKVWSTDHGHWHDIPK
jgi:hypothetical protein